MKLEKKYNKIKKLIRILKNLDYIHNEKQILINKLYYLEEEYEELLVSKKNLETKLIPVLEPDEINKDLYDIKNIVKDKLNK